MVQLEGNMSLKNPVTPPGIDPGTVRLVAQRLNHYATPDSVLVTIFLDLYKYKSIKSNLTFAHSIRKLNCSASLADLNNHIVILYTEITIAVLKTPSGLQHFNIQLTHTTLKNVELLKHFKISKYAPTCFGLRGNPHQGATVST